MAARTRDTLGQVIAHKLEAAIIAGDLPSGTRLDEASLAERYDASRTPVREALQILSARALVTRVPFSGTVVSEITRQRISELFEAMGEIEALCGRLAAERMSEDERARLSRLHAQMGALAAAQATEDYLTANTAFHQALYRGTRNSEVQGMAEAMRLKLAPFRRRQLADNARIARSHLEHDQIVVAVMQRNAAATERALRRHLTSAAGTMLAHWTDPAAPRSPLSRRPTTTSGPT